MISGIEASTTDDLQAKSQKRRKPLLLKRKAITTSIFDSSKIKTDGRKGSTSGASTTAGLVFGQPLEKCLSNDNAFAVSIQKQKGSDDSGGGSLSRKSRSSITSLDNHLLSSTISSDGNYVNFCLFINTNNPANHNKNFHDCSLFFVVA